MREVKDYSVDKIKLLSQEIALTQNDPGNWSDNGMGRACYVESNISINKKLTPSLKAQVLMHKILHMILCMGAFEEKDGNSEKLVDCLANGLLSFNADNKKLVHEMFEFAWGEP